MSEKRTVRLGSGADRLERRRRSRFAIIAPLVLAAVALMAVGALLAEFMAKRSGLALPIPEWIALDVVVWIGALVVLGFLLILVQRRYGTGWALLALTVLMGVALFALNLEESIAYLRGYAWSNSRP